MPWLPHEAVLQEHPETEASAKCRAVGSYGHFFKCIGYTCAPQDYASRFNSSWWSSTKSFMALGRIICEIIISTHFIRSSMRNVLQSLSVEETSGRTRKRPFSVIAPRQHHSSRNQIGPDHVGLLQVPEDITLQLGSQSCLQCFLSVDQILYLRFVLLPFDLPYFCRIGIKSFVWGV